MLKRSLQWYFNLQAIFILFFIQTSAFGYDITDKFSVGGVLAGAYHYQLGSDVDDKGRGALPFQPEFSFRPTQKDEIFTKFGFAAGNGLNDVTEFNLAPWAADLEDDVKDINGRNRDYLLTAWYRHTFAFDDDHTLGFTGGLIDSTDYLDENRFANDEYTQFMNGSLVNGPNAFLPSYDIGGAVEWDIGNWYINAVGMNVGENDDDNNYNYFGAEIGYQLNTSLGEGNYRLIVDATSKDFLSADGDKERLMAAIISFDQDLGDIFGAWIRFGWEDDKALIDYDYVLSGGLNITGKWYGRESDNIGIGYAFLNGKNNFDYSQVAEVYWRFVLNDFFAVTVDAQYMEDKFDTDENDISGFIFGIRGAVEF